jgi:hypothetical protein
MTILTQHTAINAEKNYQNFGFQENHIIWFAKIGENRRK